MSEMLSQMPMAHSTMQKGIDAEQQLNVPTALEYLVPEEGMKFFESVNTDQNALLFNNNSTEEDASQEQEYASFSERVETDTYKTADEQSNLIIVHAPIEAPKNLKIKPRIEYGVSESELQAAAIEIPVIQHAKLYIQETTPPETPKSIETEKPIPDHSFIKQETKQTLNFLAKNRLDTNSLKQSLKDMPSFKSTLTNQHSPSHQSSDLRSSELQNLSNMKLDSSSPHIISAQASQLKEQTKPLISGDKILQSEQSEFENESKTQIKEQAGDQKHSSSRDETSQGNSYSNSKSKISGLTSQNSQTKNISQNDQSDIQINQIEKTTQTENFGSKPQLMMSQNIEAADPIQKQGQQTQAQQVAVRLVRAVNNEESHFKIKIRPNEKVEVEAKLTVDKDGNLKVQIRTNSIESLHDLKRDIQHLEKALLQTGFDKHHQHIEFDHKQTLKDEQNNHMHDSHQNNADDQTYKEKREQHRSLTPHLMSPDEEASEEIHLSSAGLNIEI